MGNSLFCLQENTTLTAAVGIVFYFMSLVQAVGFLFGYGSGNYIARCIGKDDEENAGGMAATGFVFAAFAGILIMGAGYLFLPELVGILGGSASTELNEATREMLLVFLAGVPGMTGALCLYNQLRLEGNVGRAILGMGTRILRYECVVLPFMGYTTLAGMFLQNIGQFGRASTVTSLRQGILFMPLLLTLPQFMGLTGILLVQPAADLLAFPIALVIGERQIKRLQKS